MHPLLTIRHMMAESCDQFPLRALGHVDDGVRAADVGELHQ